MLNPDLIDPLAFARDGLNLNDSRVLATFDLRLSAHEFIASKDAVCHYQVKGGQDRQGRYYLNLSVTLQLQLVCQRCLGVLPFHLESNSDIVLFANEAALDNAMIQDDTLEGIVIEPLISIAALIEDEILMALPYSPRHEDCTHSGLDEINQDKPNPFSVLANLKN